MPNLKGLETVTNDAVKELSVRSRRLHLSESELNDVRAQQMPPSEAGGDRLHGEAEEDLGREQHHKEGDANTLCLTPHAQCYLPSSDSAGGHPLRETRPAEPTR